MKRKKTLIYMIVILNLLQNLTFAQKPVTKDRQKAIIEKLATEINEKYLIKKKAKSIADSLLVVSNKVDKTLASNEFLEVINTILKIKSNDPHLVMYYDTLKYNAYLLDETEKRKLEFERDRKINFGFNKVDILEGNIGYVEMFKFSGFVGDVTANKIASVMNFVQHSDALIIDLRYNGGGDGRTVDILKTYFFPIDGKAYTDSITKQESYLTLPFVTGERYLNRPVYVLTSTGTFSAAEGFTYFMQKNKKAIIIGEKTIGGGHSGSSVSILDGYLSFIPISGENSPIENVGITPDYPTQESDALTYAKYLFYKNELKSSSSEPKENILWNITTCEYLLKTKQDTGFKFDIKNVGEYENGRSVFLKDKQPFIKYKRGTFPLVQISENEFIIDGDDMFGKANSRITFNTDKNKLGIDHRVFIREEINHKYFLKVSGK